MDECILACKDSPELSKGIRDEDVQTDVAQPAADGEGSGRPNECNLTWGRGNDQYLIPRNHRVAPGQTADPDPKPVVDHFAFTIADWDKDAVEAELKRRGLNPRPDTDDSFIIKDPDGFNLQIQGPECRKSRLHAEKVIADLIGRYCCAVTF